MRRRSSARGNRAPIEPSKSIDVSNFNNSSAQLYTGSELLREKRIPDKSKKQSLL